MTAQAHRRRKFVEPQGSIPHGESLVCWAGEAALLYISSILLLHLFDIPVTLNRSPLIAMAPGSSSQLWKVIDSYKLSTGDQYTLEEQVIFHNEGFAEYFVDFTLNLQRFETILVAQLTHVSHLSLYLHSDQDEFIGFARSGKVSYPRLN
jgi:hypothetical protein